MGRRRVHVTDCVTKMNPMNEIDLDRLYNDLESDRVERKRSASDRRKIRRTICAFANDLPNHSLPGVIFIGVEDDGGCADATIDDRFLTRLANLKDDGIMPIPSLVVQKHVFSGCEVAVIVVEPSRSLPVRYRGKVWVRVGPTVRAATPDEEQILSERRHGALPFDHRPVREASMRDLDLDYFKLRYLPTAIAQEVLAENRRSTADQLRSLRLLLDDKPTWGAILGLGTDPQRWISGAYVQFLRIAGTEITDPIRCQKILAGRLDDVLGGLDDLMRLNISTGADFADTAREIRSPDYPLAALRQLARNAIMHRSYEETNAPVHVYWYSDRVWIQSPGGAYGKVTPENFGGGAVDYRNPLVSEMMYHLGFAQRFGVGLHIAKTALRRNGNPEAEFDIRPSWVRVTVRAAP